MLRKPLNINIKHVNNAIITLTIWLTILNRPMLTKNSAGAIKARQNVTNMTNYGKYNYTLDFIQNEIANSTKDKQQNFALSSKFDDIYADTNNIPKTVINEQRSFQRPSGFMLPDYSNSDYSDKNLITPKFMTSSSMSSSPIAPSDHMQPINYHRFNPHDSMPSDDKEYESYSVPDDYHHHSHHPPQHHPHHYEVVHAPVMMAPTKSISSFMSMDTLKILVIVLLKLLLIKLSIIGFIKLTLLFLLKLPILLFGFFIKILFFVKLTNLFKILSIPIILPFLLILLAPLLLPLLAPLLLLPLLLPLLLFLPIPILTITTTTTTTTTTAAPGRRRKRRYLDGSDFNRYNGDKMSKGRGDLEFFRNLIESEMCLERIACKLAADKNATPFSNYISRILETAKYYLFNPRLDSYVRAYKFGSSRGTTFASCVRYYPCTKFRT